VESAGHGTPCRRDPGFSGTPIPSANALPVDRHSGVRAQQTEIPPNFEIVGLPKDLLTQLRGAGMKCADDLSCSSIPNLGGSERIR
jgi:hypothetical protein